MERFSFIFLIAGLGFFILAFVVSAVLPIIPVADLETETIEQLAANPPLTFLELKQQYPGAYRKAFFTKTDEQVLTELKEKYPDTFAQVFTKTDEQAIAQLQRLWPDLFDTIFPDADIEEAVELLDEDRDEILEQIRGQDPDAYQKTFTVSVDAALASLEVDYALAMLRIERANPRAFSEIFEERADAEVFAEALQVGHRVYVAEGCWHCHSQQVRPWGRDEARYGQISYPEEYHNELNKPPLWGTRRVGPDLIRRGGGSQSNDWHVAHFYNPRHTSPYSVMPNYPWFFADDGVTPNRKGLSIIAYVQWLGSWQGSRAETFYQIADIERSFPGVPQPAQTERDEQLENDQDSQDEQ